MKVCLIVLNVHFKS